MRPSTDPSRGGRRARRTERAATALLAALVALGGCNRDITDPKPTPPDLSAMVEAYESPSGALAAEDLGAVVAQLDERLGVLRLLCGWEDALGIPCEGGSCGGCPLLDAVRASFAGLGGSTAGASEGEDAQSAGSIGGVSLTGTGWLRIRRLCGGHGAEPVADAANGALELILGFTEAGLDPVIWGRMEACLENVADVPLEIEGDLQIAAGGLADLSQLAEAGLIIGLEGELVAAVEGETLTSSVDIDLQLDAEGGTAFRLPLADGTSILYVVAPGGGEGFETREGLWTCDLSAATCEGPAGEVASW